MSDTDDTDALLLIPPDFYSIDSSDSESKHYGPCFTVVNTLISHVNRLEDRVNCLTNLSDISGRSLSIDSYINKPTMSNSNDLNYPMSTQSTPQKPRGKYVNNSLPSTPSTDRFSPRKSKPTYQRKLKLDQNQSDASSVATNSEKPSKEQLLDEVDKFITNVKTIQKLSLPKNLNNEYAKSKSSEESSKLDLEDVDRMLHEMEVQQHDIESKLRQKEGEILKGKRNDIEPRYTHVKTWKPGENKNSVPDLQTGMRDFMYNGLQKPTPVVEEPFVKQTVPEKLECPKPGRYDNSSKFDSELNDTSISSTDSTQITSFYNPPKKCYEQNRIVSPESERIHSNAIQVLQMHKTLQKDDEYQKPRNKDYSKYSHSNTNRSDEFKTTDSCDFGLMHLGDLWGQKDVHRDMNRGDGSVFVHKLEEERLRRQHCEQLINELQTRILEQQQKIAVAIEVDNSKDEVISRFREVWEKASHRMQNLQKENNNLEHRCNQIQRNTSAELQDAHKKVLHFESEASKALNLAHSNQDKFITLDRERLDMKNRIEELQCTIGDVKHRMASEMEKCSQLTEVLAHKEIEINKNKQVVSDAQREIVNSKRAVDLCQAELTAMKTEYNHLLLQLNDEKAFAKDLEKQKNTLIGELNASKVNEKTLQEELNQSRSQNESTKLELRNYYQEQVEIVVKDKLREFQHQLQKAEQDLQEELRKRELSIAQSAAQHMCQLTQQNKMEIRLLEEKHVEEIKLYELKLKQAHQNIEKLVAKFKQQQDKRNAVAQQLQKVMEAQWYEAMKIINGSGRSPVIPQEKIALEQLNSLKSTSFTNIQEMLALNINEDIKGYDSNTKASTNTSIGQNCSTSTIVDEDAFQLKRSSNCKVSSVPDETPVTSRNVRRGMESDLQKYIQLLLHKSPGQPVDQPSGRQQNVEKNEEPPTSDRFPAWQNPEFVDEQLQNFDVYNKGFKPVTREQRPGKPPWK